MGEMAPSPHPVLALMVSLNQGEPHRQKKDKQALKPRVDEMEPLFSLWEKGAITGSMECQFLCVVQLEFIKVKSQAKKQISRTNEN